MISATFAQVLRSGRDHFNAQFATARHADPKLDGESFSRLLAEVVDPIVQAVDASRPERTSDFVTHAYAVALELTTLRLVGPDARRSIVEVAWRRLFIPAAPLIAEQPRRALASISNAAHQLAVAKDTRPEYWLKTMEEAASKAGNLETWLTIGLIASWRAGLSHYRASALSLCDRLEPSMALIAVGVTGDAKWEDVRAKLLANPWFDPAQEQTSPRLRVAARAGAFRGFGGVFAELPRVAAFHDQFLVTSGSDCWVLTADAFGATFNRATPEEAASIQSSSSDAGGVRVDGSRVSVGGQKIELGELGKITSVAANTTTIAVTGQLTYAVILIERPGI